MQHIRVPGTCLRWVGLCGIISGVMLAGERAAFAEDPIYACVKKEGQVRIVRPGESCGRGETSIRWNVTGPRGEKGDQGDRGEKGETGERGPAGSPGAIQGQLAACSPADFAGFMVYVPGRSFNVVTGQDGAFQMDNVPAGAYDLVVLNTAGQQKAAPHADVTDTLVSLGDVLTTDTLTDPLNCGVCRAVCPAGSAPNATVTPSCTAGVCGATLTCYSGFGNCDANPANGCEVGLMNDSANCGRCGQACPVGFSCSAGACTGK